MKQRAVETLFKHKLLILMPLMIILPLTIMLALRPRPVTWQSFGVVWVDQYKPLYQDDRLVSYQGPAYSQAALLNDFLRTRGFALNVLKETGRASSLTSASAEEKAINELWRSVRVWASSPTFVTVAVTTRDPDLTYEIARATMTQYQSVLRARLETQQKLAVGIYAEELKKAEQDLAKAREELANYVALHPEYTKNQGASGLLLEAQDATLARLTSRANADQQLYNGVRERFTEIQRTSAAGLQGQQFSFTVVDEPRPPTKPIQAGRLSLVKLPVLGTVMGSMLGAALAVLLIMTNRSVMSTHDIKSSLGLPVLGEIPELRRRRRPWERSPRHAVRIRLASPARLDVGPPDAGRSGDAPGAQFASAPLG